MKTFKKLNKQKEKIMSKQYGSKKKKAHTMDIVKCVKADSGLTVGKRYLKLGSDNTNQNVLTNNDVGDREIYCADCFETVGEASI